MKNHNTPCLGEIMQAYLEKSFKDNPDLKTVSNLYKTIIEEVEKPLIQIVLKENGGNQSKAAKTLGINRNTLRKKIEELKINVSPQETD